MKIIKNKIQLLKYLDKLICGDKKKEIPKFSIAVKKSKYFRSNYKKLIFLINTHNKNVVDNVNFNQIILTSYFSATKIKEKIYQINQLNMKNLKKPKIKRNQKLKEKF